ncbi:MAG TPA: cell wall-binding repeat-containing protein [Solirubrobacteraceae bacterium]|nr:cell wall-binding repeat-containing protein [Solirubrobacteraceae bacterium]
MLGPRPLLAALLAAAALFAAACGSSDNDPDAESTPAPQVGVKGEQEDAADDLGYPAFATKNTTRVGGADAVANAAAVARAVFPDPARKPKAIALVDKDDWQGGVAAAALMAEPIGAPILLSDGDELPQATKDALAALAPTGSKETGNAQIIRIGNVPQAEGLRTTDVTGKDAGEIAARIDALVSAARGKTSTSIVVTGNAQAGIAAPAAGWAAKSGDPVLFTDRDALPAPTRQAIARHDRPKIYVLGDDAVVSAKVERQLDKLGTVERIEDGTDPVAGSIAFARYVDGAFGWGVVDPGHGLVLVNAERPMDAVAAAPLSATGTYGPLLLHTGGTALPKPLESYLLDIQPGYRQDPVRGVYNHGWVIGDESAMSTAVQGRLDALLEITRIKTSEPENESAPSS